MPMKRPDAARSTTAIAMLLAVSACATRFEVEGDGTNATDPTATSGASTGSDAEETDTANRTGGPDDDCARVENFPSYVLATTMAVHAGGDLNFNSAIAVGDFDGDAVQDVAVGWGEFDVLHVSHFLGEGDGALSSGITATPAGFLPAGALLYSARLDGDDRDDLVVASGEGAMLAAFLGTADGGLSMSGSLETAATHRISGIAIADIGANGMTDLFVTGTVSDGVVGIVNGDGAGGLARGPSVDLVGYFPSDVAAAVLRSDVLPAVMVAAADIFSEGLERLFLFEGTTSGFGARRDFDLPHGAGALALLDVDDDGRVDLAVVNGEGVQIFNTQSDGDLMLGQFIHLGGSSPVVADFNQDGHDDLAVLTPNAISILAGTGCGLTHATSVPLNGASRIAAADMNGSGRPDLVVMTSQSVEVYLAVP